MFFIFLAYFTLYNGVKNNSFESVLMRWMKLHPLALDKRLISGTEWSAEVICKEQVLDVKGETPKGPGVQIPLYVPLSLSSPANICLSNICFSISTWIAFLPFEVLNHYPQHPLLSLAKMVFKVRPSAIWVSYSVFLEYLPYIHLFNFFLLICFLLMQFLGQPESLKG